MPTRKRMQKTIKPCHQNSGGKNEREDSFSQGPIVLPYQLRRLYNFQSFAHPGESTVN